MNWRPMQEFSAEHVGNTFVVKCYQCCCVTVPRGQSRPIKFVNRLAVPITKECNSALAAKLQQYKYPFECFPNSEKRAIVYDLIRQLYDQYPALSGSPALPDKEAVDGFFCCYLGICERADSVQLINRTNQVATLKALGSRKTQLRVQE